MRRAARHATPLGIACLLWVAGGAGARPAGADLRFRADHMVLDVAVAGPRIFAATQSGRIEVFDWKEGRTLAPLLTLETAADRDFPPTVQALGLSPDGGRCAAASSDGVLRLLELDEAGAARPSRTLDRVGVRRILFLDDDRVLLGDLRGDLALLDLRDGREPYRRQLEYDPIYALALSPDGRRAAVAFRSSRIQIVASETGETLHVLRGHRGAVFDVAWIDDQHLASASKDKSVLLWELDREEPSGRTLYHGDDYVMAIAAEPSAGLLAFAVEETKVALLSLATGELTHVFEGHTAPVQALRFVDGGRKLVSAGNDAQVIVWTVPGAQHPRRIR